MNNVDLCELSGILRDYPDPFEFKNAIINWLLEYDKR
jgi:hypothetical protein